MCCPNCYGNVKKEPQDFIDEINRINPTIEIIGNYTNNHTRIDVKCRVCGYEWSAWPKALLRGASHRNWKYIHEKMIDKEMNA